MQKNINNSKVSFFHAQVPVDAICIYRLGFGFLLCFEMMGKLPYSAELFSSQGFHSGLLASYAPEPFLALCLCALLIVSTLFIAVGFCSRFSITVSLFAWTYLFLLDTINERSIDSIVIILLGILLFSDCFARYSVDDWIRRHRNLARKNARTCVFWQRLLQIEFAQVYFFSGLVKMVNPEWVKGSTLANVFVSRWALPLGVWISDRMPSVGFRAAAFATVLYEMVGSVLLFFRDSRSFAIAAGLVFHIAILLTLDVGFLGWHFIWALLILFPDPHAVSRFMESRKKRSEAPADAG